MKEKICHGFFIVIIIALLTGNVLFWASKKEGFHLDELYSYNQIANTDYSKPEFDRPNEPFLNSWHDRSCYEDFLTVDKDEAFNVSAFYESASRNGAHPPLYLTLFGIFVSAFSPDNFTKWSGITFNIIFYILTLLVLYDLSANVMKNRKAAIISVILYGGSICAVSTVLFIRVYMMLTFFTVSYFDLHIHLLNKELDTSCPIRKRLPAYIGIIIALILGALSQYYFVVLAFFVGLMYFLILLASKKNRLLVEYILINLTALSLYIAIWPNFFRDLLSGPRGPEAIGNLKKSPDQFGVQFGHYLSEIDEHLTGGKGILLLLIIAVLLLIKIVKIYAVRIVVEKDASFELSCDRSANEKSADMSGKIKLGKEYLLVLFITLPTICYLFLITRIAPILLYDLYKDIRYLFNIIPLFIVINVFFIVKVFHKFYNRRSYKIASAILLIALTILAYSTKDVDYLYKGADDQMKQLEPFSNCRAVYVADYNHFSTNSIVYFTKNKAVYTTTPKDISTLEEAFEGADDERILLYLNDKIDGSEYVLDLIMKELNAKGKVQLFKTVGLFEADVYLLEL